MIDLKELIENRVKNIISQWDEKEIYAISFFVYSNEAYEYNGCTNVTDFHISYNTESDCQGAEPLSEERWNYAYWRQNEFPIFSIDSKEDMDILFDWYAENGVDNIGFEDYENCYDGGRYIGHGPVGYQELLGEVTTVAKRLQQTGFIQDKFGYPVPIIIHDLEYSWYVIEATKEANPTGEADEFLLAMKANSMI